VTMLVGYLVGSNHVESEAGATSSPQVPGVFSVSNLSVQPAEIQSGGIVDITVSVSNTYETWGIYDLVLNINGIKEAEKQVFVNAGSTQNATFSVSREVPGSYTVFINGLAGSFTVEKPPEEEVREVVVIKTVEVTREIPAQLRHFESVRELEDWLQWDNVRITLTADSDGMVGLHGICGDIAMCLQDRAIEDGYKLSIELLGRDEYHKWYGEWLDRGQLHAVNSAFIGNEVWFIDFATEKVWLAAYLDDSK